MDERRDIGTCYFHADFKFFITASPEERAKEGTRTAKTLGTGHLMKVFKT